MTSAIKSKAGRVLADPEQDAESKSLAAYVLGDEAPAPSRTKSELMRLRENIVGKEGQAERVALIDQQLAAM